MQTKFDWLVVTAAGSVQASAYRAQLAARRKDGLLDGFANVIVVPDPSDLRAGSGGSTFMALVEVIRRSMGRPRTTRGAGRASRTIGEVLQGMRILVIHSGGDSRRLPAYSAQGKVFAPLPMDTARGTQADLFDLVLADAASLALPEGGGILITAGDAFLGLRGEREALTRAMAAGSPGVVGVAFRASPATGARHGVYVLDHQGGVVDFLQKPSIEDQARLGAFVQDAPSARKASSKHAERPAPRVLVDTGVVYLDPGTAAAWLAATGLELTPRGAELTGILARIASASPSASPPPIDLYHHVLAAVPSSATLERYLASIKAPQEEIEYFTDLFSALHGPAFSAAVMDRCEFLHIGSTREYIQLVTTDARLRRDSEPRGSITVFNTPHRGLVRDADAGKPGNTAAPVRPRAVLEASDISRISLGGENLVVGLPRELDGAVHLPRGWGICALPVGRTHWAVAFFGDGDDCKTPLEKGGTFGNRPLSELVSRGADADAVWSDDSEPRTLWNALLWHVGPARESLRASAWMQDPSLLAPEGWRSLKRVSFARLLTLVNHERLILHRAELQRRERVARLAERLTSDRWLPAQEIARDCLGPQDRKNASRAVVRLLETAAPIEQARLHRVLAELSNGSRARVEEEKAFSAVARAVRTDFDFPASAPRAAILPDQVVWVTTPVRIDLAGGWSDTPPVCSELGGSVVNMAISLNGQFPVQVIARRIDRPVIRLSSVDLGNSRTISSAAEARAYSDPSEWAALPKAALVLAGVSPTESRAALAPWLKKFGGGIDLTVFSALPKGSGLGTSSVLGAAIIACLDRVVGRDMDARSIIRRTSILEQMMSTAGGWQDQCGGIMPGIKINRTGPGPDQTPIVTPLAASPAMQKELAERSVLYYTGHRRLARNILQKVVSRYLSRDRDAVAVIHLLKDLAERLAVAIGAGNVDEFASCVRQNWEYKKRLDPGSTNDRIEEIIAPLEKHLTGYEMPGAGGGGFLYLIARDARSARRVRSLLESRPPNHLARIFSFDIDQRGLAISVL